MTALLLRVLRVYILALGAALIGQGAVSMLLRLSGYRLPGIIQSFVKADPLHAAIHIAWGLMMLLLLARHIDEHALVWLALVFGIFYTALAILGILVYHPFGLELDHGENLFHSTVGPITLILGLRGWFLLHRHGIEAVRVR